MKLRQSWVGLSLATIASASALLFCGSGGDDTPRGGAPGVDPGLDREAGTDAPPATTPGEDAAEPSPSPELGFSSVEKLYEDDVLVVEKLIYKVGALRIFGQVCRPKGQGPHGAYIMNHGGFSGLGQDLYDATAGFEANANKSCVQTAKNGHAWFASSYRGEDGSDGAIEVCRGEVDDVLRLLTIVRTLPYVDPKRLVMYGLSHGGCITTRAVQKGAQVAAAVDVFGPTDWASDYRFWKTKLAGGDNAFYRNLVDTLDDAGGAPESAPAIWNERSPIAHDFPAALPPFQILHGSADAVVLASDSCRFAGQTPGFNAYRIFIDAGASTTPPSDCTDAGLTFRPGKAPTSVWPANRYLVVYEGLGHAITGPGGSTDQVQGLRLVGDLLTFFQVKAGDGGTP